MSPPFSIETPKPMTSLPLKRILSRGGSMKARLTFAKSPSLKLLPLARRGMFSKSFAVRIEPVTRTCKLSLGVTSTPLPSTAFCSLICAIMLSIERPNCANLRVENSINIFSSCTPYSSTLETDFTLNNC